MTALDQLIGILFWVARILIITIGGGYGIIQIVQGKSDDDPRKFREGLTYIIAAGAMFSATFAIKAIIIK